MCYMKCEKCLAALREGEEGIVSRVCAGGMKRRFLDIGLIPGTLVECIGESPLGDPRAYLIRGKSIAIRRRDAEEIKLLDS